MENPRAARRAPKGSTASEQSSRGLVGQASYHTLETCRDSTNNAPIVKCGQNAQRLPLASTRPKVHRVPRWSPEALTRLLWVSAKIATMEFLSRKRRVRSSARPAPPGKWSGNERTTACTSCDLGTQSDKGGSSCDVCRTGFYRDGKLEDGVGNDGNARFAQLGPASTSLARPFRSACVRGFTITVIFLVQYDGGRPLPALRGKHRLQEGRRDLHGHLPQQQGSPNQHQVACPGCAARVARLLGSR